MMSTPVNISSPDQQATAVMLDHHAALRRDLDERVRALRTAVRTKAKYKQPLAALTAFLTESVLPHATAEEATLYPAAAAADAGVALLVEAMTGEHRALTDRTRALTNARSSVEALAVAEGIAAVFTLHLDKENELLLPALTRIPGVSLAALLQAMHQRLDELQAAPDTADHADERGAETPEELDVRTLPHGAGRHEVIFARLAALDPGNRLVILNDHDPKPLHYQIDAAWPEVFAWEYLQAGPQVWRVAITRRA